MGFFVMLQALPKNPDSQYENVYVELFDESFKNQSLRRYLDNHIETKVVVE